MSIHVEFEFYDVVWVFLPCVIWSILKQLHLC